MNDECLNPNDEGMTQSELQTHGPRTSLCMTSSFGLRPYLVILAFVISHSLGAQQPYKKAISVGEPPPDHSPEAELASFKVLDGFEVNLFASEKDEVPNPLVIRWDERGRLWVLSTTAYPQPAPDEVCNDQVLILEDTDHDGRADKRTVYADGLRMPMGMELAGPGELYVGEGEKLWLFKDTNGDDQVDEKEVIFSGFGTGDTHQNINSFIWSPDGALVMHQGLHCYSRVTTAWGVKQLYGAGFWRFWPRSRKLEAYPTGMPLNPWGTAFTKEGQPIMVAGAAGMFWARPMEIEVPELPRASASPSTNKETEGLPYFLLGRFMLPHSGQIIKTDGLRKFCGVDIVGDAHWPNEMQDEIITGGFFENAIYRHKLIDDKDAPSGFEAIEQPPLITSSSVAFRPVDVRFGPEGALYIADWYDPIIGHYQASFRHPNRDKQHGRIWRVTVKGSALALDSKSRWQAYQHLRRNLPEPSAEALTRLSEQGSTHAIGTLADQLPDPLELLAPKIEHKSPRVRLEAIVACAKVKSPEAIKVALKALDKPMDTFLDRALWLLVHATAPQWKKAETLDEFLAALPPTHLSYLVEKEGSRELLDTVRKMIISDADTPPPQTKVALHRILIRKGVPEDQLRALQAGLSDISILNELSMAVDGQTRAKAPEGALPIINQLLARPDEDDRIKACEIAAVWELKATASAIHEMAAGRTAKSALVRSAAVRALARLGEPQETFEAWISDATQTWSLRVAALAALSEIKPALAGTKAAGLLDSIADDDILRVSLISLLARAAATQALAKALEAKPCSMETARRVQAVLSSSGQSDAALTAVLSKILGLKNSQPTYDPAWVAALAAEVKSAGNAAKGSAIFQQPLFGCSACHRIGQKGGIIGPELDAVGRGVPVELLIEAVVWPGRQIKEGYIASGVTLKDGRRLLGYKFSEGGGELHLKELGTGTLLRFPLSEIREHQESGSLMPEGLILNMTREELRDLIAYLGSLGR
jgi:putative membrane-bound dehydrogenase-like protein